MEKNKKLHLHKKNFMQVEKHKVVSVHYRLTVSDNNFTSEDLVEETESKRPFVFIHGTGGLLEEFEQNLHGLKSGDSFDFIIKSQNGYGELSDDNVAKIPMEAFVAPGEELDKEVICVGNFIPMTDNEGNQLQGLVVAVAEEYVVMDFNHPLAGKDLHFQGSIANVREASPQELAHGHVHGEGGVNH
jgi:FKBP-type peptidyl-prolyl cis-trans isomerase SlyD